jgi:hypothetical protein
LVVNQRASIINRNFLTPVTKASGYPCGMFPRVWLRLFWTILFLLPIGLIGGCTRKVVQTGPPPATILLIRHAEKLTDGRIDLSPIGFERARLLPKVFGPDARPDVPTPQFLFATRESAHSNRPIQTVTPLAAALHLPIDDSFKDNDYAALASTLLSGKYAGKVVLVVWHHGKIPQLATALGAKPPYKPWPEQQYDRIWRIDYVDGKVTLQDLPYALLPGDSQ